MRLSELIGALAPAHAPQTSGPSPDDVIVRGITYDSRAVAPGDLFVALRGAVHDGHAYLDDAVRLGAASSR